MGEDKKTVTLAVSGLDYATEYTLVVDGVLIDGEEVESASKRFTTPAVTDLWNLTVTPKESTLVSDGKDNTVVTFQLIDKVTGLVDTNADNIVLDLNATFGTLASKRVTIQDGKANVLLTSEFSNKNISTKIDAQIIEASGDYKDLIGQVVGTASVKFVTSIEGSVDTITMVAAEANQADRLTLFFDKEVELSDFVQTNVAGELLHTLNGTGAYTKAQLVGEDAEDINHLLKTSSVVVTQDGDTKVVKGLKTVSGNAKAIEVVLEKTSALTDNRTVAVETNLVNSLNKRTTSNTTFKLTDARSPEATSVRVEGLNTLKVKFSEATETATFKIDGQFVEPTHFTSTFGEFNPATQEDNRDLATIVLTQAYDEDGGASPSTTKAGFFAPGNHSLQISSARDFAYATDRNNEGTTQNLDFVVADDITRPTAAVKVESPEQFRVTFDKSITETDFLADAELQVYDEDAKKYVSIFDPSQAAKFGGLAATNIADLIAIEKYGSAEFVLELQEDWTTMYETSTSEENYYNDKFRIVVAEDAVTNSVNGEKNREIVLDLNYAGSALNTPDTKSASISSIDQVGTTSTFVVTMDEPVKLADTDPTDSLDNAGSTLNESQSSLPVTSVQFIGKDKTGKTVTINGDVDGYTSGIKGSDMKFNVSADLQTLVNSGYNENWTVVVKSLSDDVGNTVATATKDFKVSKVVTASKFEINQTSPGVYDVEGTLNDTNPDEVVITFTEGVQFKGGVHDATNPAQYTLNGKTLPVGTSIAVSDSNNDATDGLDTVTITLPDNTLLTSSNVITVNRNLVSYDGTVLTGEFEVDFIVTDLPAPPSTDATITGVTVDGVDAVLNPTGEYDVVLPTGTDLTTITATDVVAATTDGDATAVATTTDGGNTWTVVVTAEDGTTTETYTVNVTVAP